jgi:parvulin-like peptidyl-prolyl isomerase
MNKGLKLLVTLMSAGMLANAATLVTVNGVAISEQDVMKALMVGTQGRYLQLPQEKQSELRNRIIQSLIMEELVYTDAKKSGVLDTTEYKEGVKEAMKRVERQLAMKVWEKQQFDKISVEPTAVKAYYKSNPQEFMDKEKVHARHILVKTEKEANDLLGKLKSLKGEALKNKVAELAKAESTCTSAPKGGDLGTFVKGRMVPEFDEAVFKMDVGTITQKPVQTTFGYHIIYLEEKMAPKKRTFDEVKESIERRLQYEKYNKAMETKIKSLEKAATIKFN